MKIHILSLLLILASQAFGQQARLQVIHNSADVAATQVDVYLNGNLLLDDFTFRTATPFIDAPAGVPINVAIAAATSTSVADSIKSFDYTLSANATYILIAEGIVSGSGYSPATPFDIKVYDMGREQAMTSGNTDVLVHHGATDAPAVDVYESSVPAGNIVTNAAYGDFSGYLELAAADYRLEVRPTGLTSAVASYEAPLATLSLQDSAITVVASGFLNPSNNSNGPAFGLWVALPEGGALVELPIATSIQNINKIEGLESVIYPNPVSNRILNIKTNAEENIDTTLEIFDIQGRIIQQGVLNINSGEQQQTISLNGNITEGTYFLRMTNKNQSQTLRFSVQ